MRSKILGLIAVGLLAGPMAAQAAGVAVGDREWRQLTETVGLSWDQLATVCDTTTGTCNGSIGAVSFDGWTWASNSDIQALFETLILPGSTQFPSESTNYDAASTDGVATALAPPFFTPTNVIAELEFAYIWGWSRTRTGSDAYYPYLLNRTNPQLSDSAYLGVSAYTAYTDFPLGAWLFRQAQIQVPEPGTLALLGLGIVGLGFSRRRKH